MTTAYSQLSLRKISRRYGDQRQWFALREATLDIQRGEFLAIVGPSGSGKSTLLNVVGLLDGAWEGKFEINGVDVDKLSRAERDRLRSQMFGFVFQSSYANPYETAARNAALGLAIQGKSLKYQNVQVERALETVGLSEKSDSLARNLSGGERQRLALARALVTGPEVILADEPTGNLDSAAATKVMTLLKKQNELGTTIIVITHDTAVASYADRTVEVKDGVVLDPTAAKSPAVTVARTRAKPVAPSPKGPPSLGSSLSLDPPVGLRL